MKIQFEVAATFLPEGKENTPKYFGKKFYVTGELIENFDRSRYSIRDCIKDEINRRFSIRYLDSMIEDVVDEADKFIKDREK